MTPGDRAILRAQLIRHEGLRLKPYRDTLGVLTIGVGRNLDDRGLTEGEALYLLDSDIDLCERQLVARFPWFAALDAERQRVLLDMVFNLGLTRLLDFKKMLSAVGRGDYAAAAAEMLASRWATQVGARAKRLGLMMSTGRAPGT